MCGLNIKNTTTTYVGGFRHISHSILLTTRYVGAYVIFHLLAKDITHNHTRLFKTYPEEEYFHTVHKSSISYDTQRFCFSKTEFFCFTVFHLTRT